VKRHAEQVLDQLDRLTRGALALSGSERALSLLKADIDLNAQGIGVWLSRLGAQRGASPA
jgi:hypothetical protein